MVVFLTISREKDNNNDETDKEVVESHTDFYKEEYGDQVWLSLVYLFNTHSIILSISIINTEGVNILIANIY